ncbi:hypothetical protein ACFL6B_04590 [Thermodesulfobacteriota bacterium]
MQPANVRLASYRQKQLVEKLVSKNGIRLPKPVDSLNFEEASKIIRKLIHKERAASQNNFTNSNQLVGKVDNVKLGLATKLVYNNWEYNVSLITERKDIKDDFIKEVLATYKVLAELSQRATQMAVAQ